MKFANTPKPLSTTMTHKSAITRQILAAVSASLLLVNCGYHYAWPIVSVSKLLNDEFLLPPILYSQTIWMSRLLFIGGIFGALLSFFSVDTLGRKRTLIMAKTPLIISCGIISVAKSYCWLYVARLIAGLGVGGALVVAPMYIGEIAEGELRASLCILIPVMWQIGQILVCMVIWHVTVSTFGIIGVVSAIVSATIMIWTPESPYYYAMQRNPIELQKVVNKLSGDSYEAAQELDQIQNLVGFKNNNLTSDCLDLFTVQGNRRAFAIVMGLFNCQNLSRVTAMYYLTTQSFYNCPFAIGAQDQPIVMGLAVVVPAIVVMFLQNKIGRRPLLLASTSLSIFFLSTIATYFTLQDMGIYILAPSWIPLIGTIGFLISNSIGMGMIPVVIFGEIFSCKVKGFAMSVCASYYITGLIGNDMLWEFMRDCLSYSAILYFIIGCNIASIFFMHFAVPETKGKSLSEIQTLFHAGFKILF